jgi:hypothetical protein
MALRDLFASKLAGPAGRVLDAPIRDIVHDILREHGYASPAEIQALRDELRDLRTRLEGVDRKVADLVHVAEEARSEAAAARADAVNGLALHAARTPPPADPRVALLESRVAELEASLAAARVAPSAPAAVPLAEPAAPVATEPAAPVATEPAEPLSAEPRTACKVPACGEGVRSKGFCSPHYQQWRRGTLKGFVNADGTALVDGRVVHLATSAIGAAVTSEGGQLLVDGKPTQEVAAS